MNMDNTVQVIKPANFKDPEPLPLIQSVEDQADYPLDALGPVLGDAAKAISKGVQVPESMAGQSVLAAAALAVQPFADVCIDGRKVPLSLFCMTIAGSGDRKSGTDTFALDPHSQRQRELFDQHKETFEAYRNELEAFNISRQEVLKANKAEGREALAKALAELGPPPEVPPSPVIISSEPTIEGLIKSFAGGRCSQGLFSDEGGAFFGGFGMSADNMQKTICTLSDFWGIKDIKRTRAAEGETTVIKNPRLSAHMMIQPEIARGVLANPLLSGQGFLPRFLMAEVQSIAGQRFYNNLNLSQAREIQQYNKVMTNLLKADLPIDSNGTLQPRSLELTPQAKRLWVAAYNEIEGTQAPSGQYAEIKAAASKAAEQILRIAGVIAITGDINCQAIDEDTIKRGIVLGSWYLDQAKKLQQRGDTSVELSTAQEVMDWIIKRDFETVDINTLNKGTRKVKSAKHARAIITLLEENHWLIPLVTDHQKTGAKPKELWRLNQNVNRALNRAS